MKTIGENLSIIRKKHGMSQNQIADFLGIKRELISYYENGAREIPIHYVQKICDLFGISAIKLLEGNESEITAEISFSQVSTKDLQAIASFKKIVSNYLLLVKLKD